jgi:hypothetical protein
MTVLSRERDDYLRTPGTRADFYVGPFFFYLSTADEGWLAFEIQTRWFRVSWDWKGRRA